MKSSAKVKQKHKDKSVDMLTGSLADKLVLFAIPIALSSMLLQLFNAADTAVVGRFSNSAALAAVGTNGEITAFVVSLSSGLAVGVNVLIARFIGENKKNNIREIIYSSLVLSVIAGIVLGLAGIAVSRPLLRLIKTPENVLNPAVLYLRIYFIGYPFLLLYDFGSAILRAKGDSRRPFVILAFSGIINVLFNLFFVIVCNMNVAGVALATDISTMFAAVAVIVILVSGDSERREEIEEADIQNYKNKNQYKVYDKNKYKYGSEYQYKKEYNYQDNSKKEIQKKITNMKKSDIEIMIDEVHKKSKFKIFLSSMNEKIFNRKKQKQKIHLLIHKDIKTFVRYSSQILSIGIPAALQGAVFCLANIFVQAAVNGLGETATAGSAIAMNFEYFGYYVITAFGQTATTFVSQNYAAGNKERTDKILWLCIIGAVIGSAIITVPLTVFRGFAAGLFTSDAQVVEAAGLRIMLILLYEPVCGLYEVPAGYLRGIGYSAVPAVITIIGTCLLRIFWVTVVFANVHTAESLFIAFPISWGVTTALMWLFTILCRKKA